MAEQIADDIHTALVYTNPSLKKTHLYREGATYVPLGDQKREAKVRAEAALAALTLQVSARNYTVVPPPLPPAPVRPPRPPAPPPPPVNQYRGTGWVAAKKKHQADGVQPGLELGMKRMMICRPSMIHLQDGAQPPGDTQMTPMRHQRPKDGDRASLQHGTQLVLPHQGAKSLSSPPRKFLSTSTRIPLLLPVNDAPRNLANMATLSIIPLWIARPVLPL
jgi:hypothetical protein